MAPLSNFSFSFLVLSKMWPLQLNLRLRDFGLHYLCVNSNSNACYKLPPTFLLSGLLNAFDWLTLSQVFKIHSVTSTKQGYAPLLRQGLLSLDCLLLSILLSTQLHPLGFALNHPTYFSPRISMLMCQTILPSLKIYCCYFLYSPMRICMCLRWTHF